MWCPLVAGANVDAGRLLQVEFSYGASLWPWSGHLAVHMRVSPSGADYDGLVEGLVTLSVDHQLASAGARRIEQLEILVRVRIVPVPARQQRLLWDQWHSLRYPGGYVPRDDLAVRDDPLDWRVDHVHTNFRAMYEYLRAAGFYVDVLSTGGLECFAAQNYAALLLVDAEEHFSAREIDKLERDVRLHGLSLLVFADWYNTSVGREATRFFDENSGQW